MRSEPFTLNDLKEELEEGWGIRWDGRTGAEYPPNHRIVELEMDIDNEPYTRVRQLTLPEDQYEEVEMLREEDEDSEEQEEGDE